MSTTTIAHGSIEEPAPGATPSALTSLSPARASVSYASATATNTSGYMVESSASTTSCAVRRRG
ncbi:hypothetical protein [Streptomyces phaeochromogenes]|uniref:hypothetical protein n=1 Tax=Streptomyces phaeochromogenes TaxID=1923 RepID=UPI00371DAD42